MTRISNSLHWFVVTAIFLGLFACNSKQPMNEIPSEVVAKMAAQEAAWNAGDIPSFMEIAYWDDDALLFVGSRGPTYGFEATLNNYLKSYASPEEMGQLHFELIEWKTLGPKHGFLLGSWALDRGEGLENLAGHFTLTWEQKPEVGWVIITDHSS